jgi:hypothetical protein
VLRAAIFIISGLMLFIGLPLLTGLIAAKKNRSFPAWSLTAFLMNFIAPGITPGAFAPMLSLFVLPRLNRKYPCGEKISIIMRRAEKLVLPLVYLLLFWLFAGSILMLSARFPASPGWLSSVLLGKGADVPALGSNLLNYNVLAPRLSLLFLLLAVIFQIFILLKKRFFWNFDFFFLMSAFVLWFFAVISGALWAHEAWGRYWSWDPKETWAFLTLGSLGQALLLNISSRIMEKTKKGCAVSLSFNVLSFLIALFATFGIRYFLLSLYP